MKIKHPLCLLFLLSILSLTSIQAQNGYKQANSIDLILGGDLGFRLINSENTNPENSNQYNNRSNFENAKINYRIGLNYMHGLSSNFSLKTGVRFSNPGFSIGRIEQIDPNQDINTIQKSLYIYGSQYRYDYQMIELPLGLRYNLTSNYCEPYFELGVATNYYWRSLVQELPNEGGKTNTVVNERIKRLNFIAFFSMGGNFNISDQFSGFTQLIGRYQINDLREGEVIERLVSLGLEVGVRYYL